MKHTPGKQKALFGGSVNERRAARKALAWCVAIPVVSVFFFLDGEFTLFSRFGADTVVSLSSDPGSFYFWFFIFVILPVLIGIWELFKLLRS